MMALEFEKYMRPVNTGNKNLNRLEIDFHIYKLLITLPRIALCFMNITLQGNIYAVSYTVNNKRRV